MSFFIKIFVVERGALKRSRLFKSLVGELSELQIRKSVKNIKDPIMKLKMLTPRNGQLVLCDVKTLFLSDY